MSRTRRSKLLAGCVVAVGMAGAFASAAVAAAAGAPGATRGPQDQALLAKLDAPLLFAKRFNYLGIHIYDTFYKWRPGGGIYVLENPAAPPAEQKLRAVIDPTTPETLGVGMYTHPDLSWDARRIALASFVAFAAAGTVNTAVYHWLRAKGRMLRMNTSNLFAAVVDSIIFPVIAFWPGVDPWLCAGQAGSKFFGGLFWSWLFVRIIWGAVLLDNMEPEETA